MLFFLLCAEVNVFVYKDARNGNKEAFEHSLCGIPLNDSPITCLISKFINFKGCSYEWVQCSWDKKVLMVHKEQENSFM